MPFTLFYIFFCALAFAARRALGEARDAAEIKVELKFPANCTTPPEVVELVTIVSAKLESGVSPNRAVKIEHSDVADVFTRLRLTVADASGKSVDSLVIGDIAARASGDFLFLSVDMRIQPAEDFSYDPVAVAKDLMLQTSCKSKMSSGDLTKHVSEIQLLTKREYLLPHEVQELHLLKDYEANEEELTALENFENRSRMDCQAVRLINKHFASPKTKETTDARSGFRGVFGDESIFFAGLHTYSGRPLVVGDEKLKQAMQQEFLQCTDARIRNIKTSNYGCERMSHYLPQARVMSCQQ